MSSTQLDQVWVQTTSSPQTRRATLSCSGARLPLARPAQSLQCVIREGNKADSPRCKNLWEFRIVGLNEIVGYMMDTLRRDMTWDGVVFRVDEERRAVVLTPPVRPGESAPDACRRAFSDLCERNRGKLNGCFDKWLSKPAERRDFSPIHTTAASWQDLSIPVPIRGVFGVITIGVHLNMYSVREVDGREVVDRIWVSHRAVGDSVCYSGMLDQVVAGGMDPTDCIDDLFAPGVTLKREAEEEAGLALDLDTKTVKAGSSCARARSIGTVEDAPPISFYDCKDGRAGRGSEDHLEPGVRYVYDLKLEDPTFQPRSEECGIERFEALTVDQVKRRLRERRWKPNCGLVMLDFLMRKNLITEAEDDKYAEIAADLRRPLPFKFAQEGFPFIAPWE